MHDRGIAPVVRYDQQRDAVPDELLEQLSKAVDLGFEPRRDIVTGRKE